MLASAWSTTTCLIVFPGVAVLGAECVSEPPLRSGESSKEDNVYARNKALQSAGMTIEGAEYFSRFIRSAALLTSRCTGKSPMRVRGRAASR